MEGPFEADELPLCARHGFEIAVHEPGQLAMLEAARLERPLTVWLDVDTGMNRLGFRPAAARRRLRPAAGLPGRGRDPADDPLRQRRRADRPRDPPPDRALRRTPPRASASPAPSATRPASSPGPRPMPNGSGRASCSTASRRSPAAPAPTRACAPVMTARHRPDRRARGSCRRDRGLWRRLAGGRADAHRHRRPGLRRRLPAPRALRHAGPGQRPAVRDRRPGLHGHAGGRPGRPSRRRPWAIR